MFNHSDLTFITNDENQNLLERFKVLIQDTKFFDVLVGYFYISGFHELYKSLEKTEKIRILIGMNMDTNTLEMINQSEQSELLFSYHETNEKYGRMLEEEITNADDSPSVEEGIRKFLEWLESGKLAIKAYPTRKLHAKLYIMTFFEGDRDIGRVITGSSNFTQSGLIDNLEFNVELKNRADYEFAREKFEELWKEAVDIKEKCIKTIRERTWLNDTITPYQLYLKFLYEYFKDQLSLTDDMTFRYVPTGFKPLEYQIQAALNAKKILDEYGGVFLSDVVGLGKTYISAMLARLLDGRTLVLAPPALLDKANPGSWPNVFSDFQISADFESIGKLDDVIKRGHEKYSYVFIDEAHRFRTETNITYEQLFRICRGKRVILVTATPLNNTPEDILSQIKLFQNSRQSTIPNLPDLESFFRDLSNRVKKLKKENDREKYIQTVKENAYKIREHVLKYLMVRRTRKEIETYFAEDLQKQNIKFPEVEDPKPIFYQLNKKEDEIFNQTVNLIAKELKYARYMPMLYYRGKDKPTQLEEQSQRNMGRFMKILLIKRLESSFEAFRRTVSRFIKYYESFLKEFNNGNVYISKKYANKIFELLDEEDDEKVQKLLEEDKAEKYPADEFDEQLKVDLEHDLKILKEIHHFWQQIDRDPKLLSFIDLLQQPILRDQKLIVFTESKDTAEYLSAHLPEHLRKEVLMFSGDSSEAIRQKVIDNFDARAREQKDDYRILITTEVLSEGVNLHRANVVINYDIPWNPIRLMQRIGRINRVDTRFDKIYLYNFFPSQQGDNEIELRKTAEMKIQAFITLLGTDAKLLTDGEEIESHELFDRLLNKKYLTGESETEESELKYLQVIRNIRDKEPQLFEQIKRLPKKARTARKYKESQNQLLTYFRKGKIQKFFIVSDGEPREMDFITTAKLLETTPDDEREEIPADFYPKLEKNKRAFYDITSEELKELNNTRKGRDTSSDIIKILKAYISFPQYTEDQEEYIKQVIEQLEKGAIPKKTIKELGKRIKEEVLNSNEVKVEGNKIQPNPLTLYKVLKSVIPEEVLKSHIMEIKNKYGYSPREVILSEYLIAEE